MSTNNTNTNTNTDENKNKNKMKIKITFKIKHKDDCDYKDDKNSDTSSQTMVDDDTAFAAAEDTPAGARAVATEPVETGANVTESTSHFSS